MELGLPLAGVLARSAGAELILRLVFCGVERLRRFALFAVVFVVGFFFVLRLAAGAGFFFVGFFATDFLLFGLRAFFLAGVGFLLARRFFTTVFFFFVAAARDAVFLVFFADSLRAGFFVAGFLRLFVLALLLATLRGVFFAAFFFATFFFAGACRLVTAFFFFATVPPYQNPLMTPSIQVSIT